MLQSTAPGRGGGATKAIPPSGHRTMWSARPPTDRQARACPYSCIRTIPNRARYSATFHASDPYRSARYWTSKAATRSQVKCRYTVTPASRNMRIDPAMGEPDLVGGIGHLGGGE